MTFYLDENLPPAIAEALLARGLEAISAHAVGLTGTSDPTQLAFAAGQGRCLVTCDLADFVELGREAVRRRRPHAGIILCPASLADDIGAATRALARVAERYPQGFGEYGVIFLTQEPER